MTTHMEEGMRGVLKAWEKAIKVPEGRWRLCGTGDGEETGSGKKRIY